MRNMHRHHKRILATSKNLYLFFTSLLFAVVSFAQPASKRAFEWPAAQADEQLVSHLGYVLNYAEKFEQASWVAYELTAEEAVGSFRRTNKFRPDPLVKTGSATDADYKGSGYDRGHLAPAADMGWSMQSMQESFYYSNMSPQVPALNRGVWKNLESFTRQAAITNNKIYIVTGPVLEPHPQVALQFARIGPHQVALPQSYYKVILDYSQPQLKGIAFIIPNSANANAFETYATSIDAVEALTHLNFFPTLTSEEEAKLEAVFDIHLWKSATVVQSSTRSNLSNGAPMNQCKGITKKGTRCSRTTKNPNGFCYQHQP